MDKIFSPIKERIFQFIENQGIVKEEFYEKTGISASNFKGKGALSEIGGDKIVQILTKYPKLNPEWLLIGEGQMVKNLTDLGEPNINYLLNLKSDKAKKLQQVPLYNVEATAGIVDLLNDGNRQKFIPIDYITIPNLPKCDGALPITGDSMYPLLKSGDMVLYKEVQDKSNIIWGEMYLVAISHNGDDFFFAKYLQKADREGYVKLVSQNVNHQPVEFPANSILALALIKASIRINTQF